MLTTHSNEGPQGFSQLQSIVTKEYGLRSLGMLEGTEVHVWNGDDWQLGKVELVGKNTVHPTKYALARPSGLPHMEGKDDKKWARRGGREVMVFTTEYHPWRLTDRRVLNPMLENRTVPCAAPTPNIFTEEHQKGIEAAKKMANRHQEESASTVLGEPTNGDYVFGVIMELTKMRSRNVDEDRRVLYKRRRDIIDWIMRFSVLGGYIPATQWQSKVVLDPANEGIGWKHSGGVNQPFEGNIYQIRGVHQLTLSSGILAMGDRND